MRAGSGDVGWGWGAGGVQVMSGLKVAGQL